MWASVRFVDDDGREEETPRWVRLLPARRDDALVEDADMVISVRSGYDR